MEQWLQYVREHLTISRDNGLPFLDAWLDAMQAHPPRMSESQGWTMETVSFAQTAFRSAYDGHAYTFNVAPPEKEGNVPVHVQLGIAQPRCKSGDRCSRVPMDDGRFCELHQQELDRIRGLYESGAKTSREYHIFGTERAREDAALDEWKRA